MDVEAYMVLKNPAIQKKWPILQAAKLFKDTHKSRATPPMENNCCSESKKPQAPTKEAGPGSLNPRKLDWNTSGNAMSAVRAVMKTGPTPTLHKVNYAQQIPCCWHNTTP